MDRTTIMLPPELKSQAVNQAKKMRISLGQYIRLALKNSLKRESGPEYEDDPFMQDSAIFQGRIPENGSASHDEYLYGGKG